MIHVTKPDWEYTGRQNIEESAQPFQFEESLVEYLKYPTIRAIRIKVKEDGPPIVSLMKDADILENMPKEYIQEKAANYQALNAIDLYFMYDKVCPTGRFITVTNVLTSRIILQAKRNKRS